MLERFSLDQIRLFVTVAEQGSFSAAARKIHRAQSAVSEQIRRLEDEFGLKLFDRSARSPKLTPAGEALLRDARAFSATADALMSHAKSLSRGLEPELVAVIDVYFPFQQVAEAAREFQKVFPSTPLRLYVETLGGAIEPVVERRASFSVVGGPAPLPADLAGEPLGGVLAIMVAAPEHPLAKISGVIPPAELARHVQLALTERSKNWAAREYSVMSPQVWRLADLYAKHSFLLNGLGFGSMPLHAVARDLAEGRLKKLATADVPESGLLAPMAAVYRLDSPPGPAGRWLIERLKNCASSSSQN